MMKYLLTVMALVMALPALGKDIPNNCSSHLMQKF